jgi:signal transduction histidine kinase
VHLYRIAQEALANIARHSGAEHVEVEWTTGPGACATLRIADDGNGFDPDLPCPGHFGLTNMRSRAQEIGAVLTITSAPGLGTQLRVDLGVKIESEPSDEH